MKKHIEKRIKKIDILLNKNLTEESDNNDATSYLMGRRFELLMLRKKLKKEKEEFQKKYEFTSCDSCVNKINKVYQSECISCKHYYGSRFERKEK